MPKSEGGLSSTIIWNDFQDYGVAGRILGGRQSLAAEYGGQECPPACTEGILRSTIILNDFQDYGVAGRILGGRQSLAAE